MTQIKFAPTKIFNQILKYAVIPTFDLVIQYGNQGIIIVKRKYPPYKNVWALPGLRILKGETIDQTLTRIARDELGLIINPKNKIFLSQYLAKFKTENSRCDLSTGYYLKATDWQPITINKNHFNNYKITDKIPNNMGAMYKFFLKKYYSL